jgi:hypothetical protein
VAPRRVTLPQREATLAELVREIERQTNLSVGIVEGERRCTAAFRDTPFWEALAAVAAKTGHRVRVGGEGGSVVTLVRHDGPPPPASVDGPFRIVAREIHVRGDLEAGRTDYVLSLDVHWEPRFPVYRMDGHPTITRAVDDLGNALKPAAGSARVPVAGYAAPAQVRLGGVQRKAQRIAVLEGSFRVTAADELLAFRFTDLGSGPREETRSGVTVRVASPRKVGSSWVFDVDLTYPPGQPTFESFESWLTANRIRLVSPDGRREFAPSGSEILQSGSGARIRYRFREDRQEGLVLGDVKGWSIAYRTPSPLKEFEVKFALRDVPLP